jgi:hypothetical protein
MRPENQGRKVRRPRLVLTRVNGVNVGMNAIPSVCKVSRDQYETWRKRSHFRSHFTLTGIITTHNSLIIRNGRAGGIRTHDPLPPRQVRYQTALQPVS